MGSDPKMPTIPRVTTGKFSSKRLPSLKLPAAFPTLIPEGKAFTMSWDDQVSAEESRDLVFRPEIASQIPMLGPLNIIYGSAELAPQLERECDVMRDCEVSSHTLLYTVTCNSVIYNITHDTDLWDGDQHVMSLSGCNMHLEADTKMLATSLICLVCFIQKHPLKGCPIE